MKRIAIALALFAIGCASPRTYMGKAVQDMSFPIAGNQTVVLPITDAGPIPAETDSIKIEVAGFNVGPSKKDSRTPLLTWMFGFTSKKGQEIEQVIVEEVSPSNPANLAVKDDAPKLKGNIWSGSSAPIEVNAQITPWLYSQKASVFIFKFTIAVKGEPTQVLYQPAWFPAQTKAIFTSDAENIRNGK